MPSHTRRGVALAALVAAVLALTAAPARAGGSGEGDPDPVVLAFADPDGGLHVVYTGADAAGVPWYGWDLREQYQRGDGTTVLRSVQADAGHAGDLYWIPCGQPATMDRAYPGSGIVYTGCGDRHVHVLSFDGQHWRPQGFSDQTCGVISAFQSRWRWPGTRVEYVGCDYHIHELFQDATGWYPADLTGLTGAEPVCGTLSAFESALWYTASRIEYAGCDNHVHEMWLDAGGWHTADLTSSFGGAPICDGAISTWETGSYFPGSRIEYVGCDGHIDELYLDWRGWHPADLTVLTGAPPVADAVNGGQIGLNHFTVLESLGAHTATRIEYLGQDRHIHELALDASGWHPAADLSALAGAPNACDRSSISAYWQYWPSVTHIVYPVCTATHAVAALHDLTLGNDGIWHDLVLPADDLLQSP